MIMLMMNVRVVRVCVANRGVLVQVRMGPARVDAEWVAVLTVRILLVSVLVGEGRVIMHVIVDLRSVQP